VGQHRLRLGLGGHRVRRSADGSTGQRPSTSEPRRGRVRPRPVRPVVGKAYPRPRGPTPSPLDGGWRARLRGAFDEVVIRPANQPIAVVAVTGRVVDEPSGSLSNPGGRASRPARAEPALWLSWNVGAKSLEVGVSQMHVANLSFRFPHRSRQMNREGPDRPSAVAAPSVLVANPTATGEGPRARLALPGKSRFSGAGGGCSGRGGGRLGGLGHAADVGHPDLAPLVGVGRNLADTAMGEQLHGDPVELVEPFESHQHG
jgi:hypothetical protein